jgi:hypothetical protein
LRGRALSILALFLGILTLGSGCGKKADPFIPEKSFAPRVEALGGQWEGESIILKGKIIYPEGREGPEDTIQGLRLFYASFPINESPCPGCPVQYEGMWNFGPEIIVGDSFVCRVNPDEMDRLYVIKVHLIGPEGILGPASDRLRVPAR